MTDRKPDLPNATIDIMRRLVNSPPKPHDAMAQKRKGAAEPEKRTVGKGRARVGKARS